MALSFKEQVSKDIGAVFFDPEVFGEEHVIDGKRMDVVLDEAALEGHEWERNEYSRVDGIHQAEVAFYVPRDTFGELPAHNRAVRFDGISYRVAGAVDQGGVYAIRLRRYKS